MKLLTAFTLITLLACDPFLAPELACEDCNSLIGKRWYNNLTRDYFVAFEGEDCKLSEDFILNADGTVSVWQNGVTGSPRAVVTERFVHRVATYNITQQNDTCLVTIFFDQTMYAANYSQFDCTTAGLNTSGRYFAIGWNYWNESEATQQEMTIIPNECDDFYRGIPAFPYSTTPR